MLCKISTFIFLGWEKKRVSDSGGIVECYFPIVNVATGLLLHSTVLLENSGCSDANSKITNLEELSLHDSVHLVACLH